MRNITIDRHLIRTIYSRYFIHSIDSIVQEKILVSVICNFQNFTNSWLDRAGSFFANESLHRVKRARARSRGN